MELYSISDIANICKISKTAVYNKLKLKDFKKYIIKKGNVKYLNNDGLKAILSSLNKVENKVESVVENTQKNQKNSTVINEELQEVSTNLLKLNSKLIKQLEEENAFLRQEIKIKNDQIEKANQLIENTQILLGHAQQNFIEEVAVSSTAPEQEENTQTAKNKKKWYRNIFK